MGVGDDVGDRCGGAGIDRPGFCYMIERQTLVETNHIDGPFDRKPFAINVEPSILVACNGNNASIDLRRKLPVNVHLFFAGCLPLAQCRVVEERKADGPLDFQRAIA